MGGGAHIERSPAGEGPEAIDILQTLPGDIVGVLEPHFAYGYEIYGILLQRPVYQRSQLEGPDLPALADRSALLTLPWDLFPDLFMAVTMSPASE